VDETPQAATVTPAEPGFAARIRVVEIFGPTIQGEGSLIGLPTIFVRTGGCDYRCAWCDSLHAVLPQYREEWHPMTPGAIVESVRSLAGGRPILVTLSGGNPALQPLEPLIHEGQAQGLTFALETQGSAPRAWFRLLDHLVLSPKPPSSGETCDFRILNECIRAAASAKNRCAITMKVVVFDDADLDFAAQVRDRWCSPALPLVLQVGNPEVAPLAFPVTRALHANTLLRSLATLTEQVLARGWYDVRVLPQLHTLIWGNVRGR
jgi:7-carboxy-7-deazaguanine synthase